MRIADAEVLFAEDSLDRVLSARFSRLMQEIDDADEDQLLNADVDTWIAELAVDYAVELPRLRRDEIEAEDLGDVRVPVPNDPFRDLGSVRPGATLPGHHVIVHVPFDGEYELFRYRPNQWSMSPPKGILREAELVLDFRYPSDQKPAIKTTTEKFVSDVEQHLGWAAAKSPPTSGSCRTRPAGHRGAARAPQGASRLRLRPRHPHSSARRRAPDVPRGGIVRRPAPSRTAEATRGRRSRQPPQLEPTLAEDLYDHIVSVIRAAATRWCGVPRRTRAGARSNGGTCSS